MRKMIVTCDICKGVVEKFNGAVTLAAWGTIHKDACSPKCLAAILHGLVTDIEKRENMKAADNVAFAAEHPEATMLPEAKPVSPPAQVAPESDPDFVPLPATESWTDPNGTPIALVEPSAPAGCAACDAGVEVNKETAYRHTGDGKLCKMMKPGPCACTPDNWKMTPPNTSTPGPREVECQKCGVCWSSMIRDPEAEAAANAGAPAPKRKGRPPGSRNKTTNGTQSALSAPVTAEATRDQALGRAPDTAPSELERLKAKRDQEEANAGALRGPGSAFSPPAAAEIPAGVNQGLPGERIDQIVTDAAKIGVKLNLVDVAAWPVLKRDVVREWLAQGGSADSRPDFLEPPPPPPPIVAAPTPAAQKWF
jgi:hypothetical protein